MGLAAQTLPPHRSTVPVPETVIYVRPWGDNSRSGLTPGTDAGSPGDALSEDGGLEEADRRMPLTLHGERFAIDVTGCDITIPRNWALKSPVTGDQPALELFPVDHPSFLVRACVMIRALPDVVLTLNSPTTTTVAEATHGMLVVTDTSQVFAVNEHAGRLLAGSSFFEWGRIQENTATELVIAHGGMLSPPFEIWDPGATLTIGDPGEFFGVPGFTLLAYCPVVLQGLRIRAPAAFSSALSVCNPGGTLNVWHCDVEGVQFEGGAGVFVDGCYFPGKTFSQNQPLDVKRSVFAGPTIASQGVGAGGSQFVFHNRFVGCTAWPLFGAPDFGGGFQVEACAVEDAVGSGLQFTGGLRGSVRDTSVDDVVTSPGLAGDAVRAVGPGRLDVRNVTGSGNAGHGVGVQDGTQARVQSTTTVTGTSGDLLVGSLGTKTFGELDVAGGNLVDVTSAGAQLVRVFR